MNILKKKALNMLKNPYNYVQIFTKYRLIKSWIKFHRAKDKRDISKLCHLSPEICKRFEQLSLEALDNNYFVFHYNIIRLYCFVVVGY